MKKGKRWIIKCTLRRGGTSKGVYVLEKDLPKNQQIRDKIILSIFGSPDLRQIDGLGGANPSTSKIAIIGPPTRADADIDYTFGQVGISSPNVDYRGNCGNISSGVGPFAIQQGLVKEVEPFTIIKIHNTNTGKIIVASVPFKDGEVVEEGEYAIAGVPGTGAKIALDFKETIGAVSGSLLPTGSAKEKVDIKGIGELFISIVDFANPVVFVRASDIGIKGIEEPSMIDSNISLAEYLESIRGTAAKMIGLVKRGKDARRESPLLPLIAFVSQAADYKSYMTRQEIHENSMDLVARAMHTKQRLVMHETYPVTVSVCTGVAAMIHGTIVQEVVRNTCGEEKRVRIGHPSGVVIVEVDVREEGGTFAVERAALGRTSRRIMEGLAYVKWSM